MVKHVAALKEIRRKIEEYDTDGWITSFAEDDALDWAIAELEQRYPAQAEVVGTADSSPPVDWMPR